MSYQNLNDLVEEIKSGLLKLENSELSVTDVDAIQANAKELFERLTVLKYLALERLADGSKNDISSQESLDSEDAEIQPIKIKIGNPEEKVPENQTNLLDAIEESGVDLEPVSYTHLRAHET